MICRSCGTDNDSGADNCIQCGRGLLALVPGDVLSGRYEIVGVLGRGGMGTVYKARDRELDDDIVAIKVLRAAMSADMVKRFRAEIRLARRVRHVNVCAIHEYGQDEQFRYIVMEYIEGVDIRRLLRERPLAIGEAFDIAIQVARGLQAIHEVGVVHRDLKTPNIMRGRSGGVRVMDFGIAKQFEAEGVTDVTQAGQLLGTPEYMSPEQARGERVDPRSDVYALGIVVFELFVGHVPFRTDSPIATLRKHLEEPPPLTGVERLPFPLVPILAKALAKDKADRYGSAAEVADALVEAQAQMASNSWDATPARVLSALAPDPVIVPASTDEWPTPLPTVTPTVPPTPLPRSIPTPVPGKTAGAVPTEAMSPRTAPAEAPPISDRKPREAPRQEGDRPGRRLEIAPTDIHHALGWWRALAKKPLLTSTAAVGLAILIFIFYVVFRGPSSSPTPLPVVTTPTVPRAASTTTSTTTPTTTPTTPTTPPPPPLRLTAPIILEPTGKDRVPYAGSVRFAWQAVKGAAKYRLEVANSSSFARLSVPPQLVKDSEHDLPGLRPGSYYWRVTPISASGVEGAFSPVGRFEIASPPSSTSPSTSTTTTSTTSTTTTTTSTTLPAPGTLELSVKQSADVAVDGKALGRTSDNKRFTLSAGEHRVSLIYRGCTLVRTVEIASGTVTRLDSHGRPLDIKDQGVCPKP
jgi:serine/threonine protein kinase